MRNRHGSSKSGNQTQTGLSTRKDRLGRFRFRPDTTVSFGSGEVRRMQEEVLGGLLDEESVECRTIAHLILFDGICTLDDIHNAVTNLHHSYSYDGQCVLDWLDTDGRQNRRILGPLTRCLQPWLVTPTGMQQINDYLLRLTTMLYRGDPQPASRLLRDVQFYCSEVMPGALFAHVAHLAPITALPRTALAREISRMSLAMTEAEEKSSPSAHAMGVAIDHVMQSDARRGSMALVDRIIAICHQHSRRNDAQDKRNMLNDLIKEAERVGQTDGLSALLLAWVIDFVESGGLKEKNPRPQTIEKYVRNVLRGLHGQLGGQDIFQLTAEDFMKAYLEILSAAKPGNQTHSLTGLKTWHAFLVVWFDVPRLMTGLDEKDSPVIPKANVVWPHEISEVLNWIESSQLDERLRTQLDLCIRLASNIRLRASELFTLRRFNIRCDGLVVEVEIAPQANTGSLKSDSARRVQVVRDPEAIRRLRAWNERREREGALRADYLFGDPYHPDRVYRLGSTYLLVNRLLKRVTGDASVSLHTLSHTWASQAIRRALTEPDDVDVPPLELIANAAGHRSAETTLTHYFHFPAEVIRHCLDQELSQLKLSSKTASRWSGVKDPALRKRASERKQPSQEINWAAILAADVPLPARGVEFDITLRQAAAPEILKSASTPSREAVMQAVGDLAIGTPHEQIALRLGIAPSVVERIRVIAMSVAGRLKATRRMTAQLSRVAPLVSPTSMSDLGIDFSRLSQARWNEVRKYLYGMQQPDLSDLVLAWTESYDRGYLDLRDEQHCIRIFGFLHTAGIPSNQLAIAISCADPNRPSAKELMIEATTGRIFERWFGLPPLIDHIKLRRSRPPVYLIWSSHRLRVGESAASASASLAGFHALMLGNAVFLELSKTTSFRSEKDMK